MNESGGANPENSFDDDILEEFLIESYENLDSLDRELVELEQHPASDGLLGSIFRSLHTVKGTAGFFSFVKLGEVAHAAESVLNGLRAGTFPLTTAIMDGLFAAVDAVRQMIDQIQESGMDGTVDHSALVASLLELIEEGDGSSEETTMAPHSEPQTAEAAEPAEEPSTMPDPAVLAPEVTTPEVAAPSPEAEHATSVADATIRVDVGLLDRLMNLVGELVLARNQVLQYEATEGSAGFHTTSQHLNLVTTELQEGVMKTRMQPVGNVWAKMPRLVRDLAASCGKQVQLVMEGEDTELDKTLLEAIKDPLTHIVRNAIDHGIETPDVREAAGKSATGLLRLRALHEGGQVLIEISDDGSGLDLDRLRSKAVASGFITAERAQQMSDREAAELIFEAGVSTAKEVTNVSGRGVGMDVVRTNIEKIGGSHDIQFKRGEGTTLTLRIPLTLAIIPALVVSCGDARFMIPQINLVEVLHITSASADARVEMAGDAPVLRLRGNLLPIVHLRGALGMPPLGDTFSSSRSTAQDHDALTSEEEGVNIVVVRADGFEFALTVDQINDTEEIVVKPLSPHLTGLGAYSGTTIMGDGAVSLILDAIGIARLGGVVRAAEGRHDDDSTADSDADWRGSAESILVCAVGDQRIGVPLTMISRLEELRWSDVERAAGREVIQYRDRLLRLIHVGDLLGMPRRDDSDDATPETLSVLVHEVEDRIFGLVVDEIIDVFETDLASGEVATRPELTMSGVIGRRVTDMLDIDRIVADALSPASPVLT